MKRIVLIMLFTVCSHFVFAQTTDFSYQNTSSNNCLPAEIQFTQTSSGTPRGYLWDFGNGVESNSANPVVTYTAAGYYTVRLITVYDNSTAQKTRTILISPSISASFSADRVFMCRPGTINFTASNSGNLGTYVWDFGDGTSPVTGSANAVSHTYSGYGEFTVTLTATSATGCSVSHSEVVRIQAPRVSGSITSPTLGCIPMTTTFSANTSLPTGSSVTNYAWDFGDGNVLNTTQPSASHTYEQIGSFSPTLVITTNEGCNGNFRFDSVAFGRPPVNHDAYPLDTVYCGSETPQFVAVASTANRYDWDFGGGHITSVTDTFVEHRYNTLGYKNITVTPYFNGCAGNPENFRIEIIGVIARFSYANTCLDKKTFLFDNNTVGHVSTTSWNLGNQQYSNNMDTVSATYPTFGTFGVKMLVTDDITGCIDSFKTKIYTADPVMQNPDASICINSVSHFSVINNYENPGLNYTWWVLGDTLGPGMEPAPAITASTVGEFSNTVILDNGPQYCPDTLLLDHTIKVRGPRLDFTAPDEVCLNTPLTVVNHSAPYQASDSIRTWTWDFGYTGSVTNVYQPPPHNFPVSRPYNVKLTATDIFGCQDSLVKRVWARPMPFLWIIPKLDTLCQGESSTLIGYTSDDISWLPASPGFCTNCDTTTVSPVNSTRYFATATNSFNCSVTDSAFVKVFNPFTANILTADTSVCGGTSVQLEVDPKDKVITWSPASSVSNASIHNPVAKPEVSTTYTAALTDSAGCFSSQASMDIRVKTKPTVNAGPDKAYPYAANFTLSPEYSNNIRSWAWTPTDSLSCGDCPSPIGIAGSTKTYTVEVVSDSGCVAKDNITIFVECNGANLLMPGAFTPNNDNLNDYYFPITRGIRSITRFAIFNREGQLVYEMRDFTPNKERAGWDGRLRGQPQTGAAYMYVVEAVCDMGQTIFSKGSFLLIR